MREIWCWGLTRRVSCIPLLGPRSLSIRVQSNGGVHEARGAASQDAPMLLLGLLAGIAARASCVEAVAGVVDVAAVQLAHAARLVLSAHAELAVARIDVVAQGCCGRAMAANATLMMHRRVL